MASLRPNAKYRSTISKPASHVTQPTNRQIGLTKKQDKKTSEFRTFLDKVQKHMHTYVLYSIIIFK